MTIRASAFLGLAVAVLAACGGEPPAAFEDEASDAAVADAAVVEGAAGYGAASARAPRMEATAATTSASEHTVAVGSSANAARDAAPTTDVATTALLAELSELAITDESGEIDRVRSDSAHEDGEVDGPDEEADAAPAPNPYPGLALASGIAGIRALVGSAGDGAVVRGAPRVLRDQYSVLALARAKDGTLDAASRAWRRRSVRVVTSANQQCRGHIADLELASQWIWTDELWEAEASTAAMRDTLSGMLGDVLAHVVLDEPCRGAPILVEDPSRSHARIARTLQRIPRERAILDAFRSLPRYRALRAECEQLGQCMQEDLAVPAGRPIDLSAFQFPGDRSVYVVASMSEASCGDWGPPMSAIFQLEAGPAPKLYRANDDAELGRPTLLLDVDADGVLELVTSRNAADLELIDEAGATRQSWSTHFIGCGC